MNNKRKLTIESMRISIGDKKFELRFAGEDEHTCYCCAFYGKRFQDLNLDCPSLYEDGSILYPCVCRETNFRGYWVEVKQ